MRKITRILEIIFILFISIFVLDVIEQEKWLLALLIHLIPTCVLIILTIISWKKEFLGGILWILTAIVTSLMTGIDWIITAPMIVIGGLNLWIGRKNQ